jgi:4-hydroxybenzoate polyprenyltransferase
MRDILALIRPAQWVKNAFVLAPLVFAQRFFVAEELAHAGIAVLSFCCASSAAYAFNDIVDRHRDRSHPLKCDRPVAAGRVSVRTASITGSVALLGALLSAASLNTPFIGVVGVFCLLQIAYSTVLKNIVVVDSMSIAVGFTLRAAGGVVAVGAAMSPWLLVCTFLLALFLALGKRRHESTLLGDDAGVHRDVLGRYSLRLLDQFIAISAVSTTIVYALYCISPEVAAKLGTEYLYLTIPFVVFGVFRYLFLVYGREEGGSPTEVLLGDGPLQLGIFGWIAAVFLLLYG